MSVIFIDRGHLLTNLMDKLVGVHESSGGLINTVDDYDPNKLDAFDNKLLEINSKMMLLRDDTREYHRNRKKFAGKGSIQELRDSQERLLIMLRSIKKDHSALEAMVKVDTEENFFTFKSKTEKLKNERQAMCDTIDQKLNELERRIHVDRETEIQNQKIRDQMNAAAQSDDDDDDGLGELPENAPEINEDGVEVTIAAAAAEKEDAEYGDFINVDKQREKLEAMKEFERKKAFELVEAIRDIAETQKGIDNSLEESKDLLNDMQKRADKMKNDLEKITTKGFDEAQAQASGQVKFVIIIVAILLLILLAGMGVIVLAAMFKSSQ